MLALFFRHRHIAPHMTATVHNLNRGAPPSLEPMMSLVADNMNAVNSVILERMQSKIPLIPELAGHLIAGGGKRLRPMLTLACDELLEYHGARHHKLAAAVELISAATLLHAAVVDGSGMLHRLSTSSRICGYSARAPVGK